MLQLTTPAGASVRLTAAKATGPRAGTATAFGTPLDGFASYVFTLRNATCGTCAPLTFTSKTPTGVFTNLEPGTKVNRTSEAVGRLEYCRTGMGAAQCVGLWQDLPAGP